MTTAKTEVKEITIFKDLTTNEYLADLKAESEKYTGLYVDMNEPEQRKYVKDKTEGINKILKQLDIKRIALTKEFRTKVEAEAVDIKERLEIANLPFTLLIDEHKAERKKILDAEKAEKEAIELAVKIEADHEFALLMNDKFDSDKIIAEQEKREYEQKIKDEAVAQAKAQAEFEHQEKERIEREEAQAREQNKAHKAKINNIILDVLKGNGISEEDAKTVIKLAAQGKLPNVKVNY